MPISQLEQIFLSSTTTRDMSPSRYEAISETSSACSSFATPTFSCASESHTSVSWPNHQSMRTVARLTQAA